MKKLLTLSAICILYAKIADSQGCVIVRNISGFGQYNFADNSFSTSDWFINVTSRYFNSYRDFRGTTEVNPPKDSTHSIQSFTTDITISRLLANGWSLTLSLPISANSRTSKLEHGGITNPAHTTHSFGVGDIRFAAYKWLLKPRANQKINFQLALGIKLPTGDYKYQDYFYRKEDSAILAPVSPAIQLGDGGTGIITELNIFYVLSKTISFYGNLHYLLNPRDQNGTSNLAGRMPTTPALIYQVKAGGTVNSVPDQYTMRAGADLKLDNWVLSVGIRNEGIPVYDLIGGSNGNRRAGHNTSIEPGIVYSKRKFSIYAYIPVIVSREIKQSVPDKKETELKKEYTHRSGGSADYLVFVGVQFKL